MSAKSARRNHFEARLLDELRSLVAAQAGHDPEQPRGGRALTSRRRVMLVAAAAVVLALAAAAGVPLLSGGTAPAYAVTKNDDGTVTVEIASLRDAAGLERELREAGIHAVVAYLPPGKACKQPWPTTSGGPTHDEASPSHSAVEHTSEGHVRFTVGGHHPGDATLVILTQVGDRAIESSLEEAAIAITFAPGEVERCRIVDAPVGSGPFGGPRP